MSPVKSPQPANEVQEKDQPLQQEPTTTSALPVARPEEQPAASTSRSNTSSSGSPSTSELDEKEKEKKSSDTPPAEASQWQAVWAPQYNAYYFYNSVTQETTWSNPLEPQASTPPPSPGQASPSTSTEVKDANAEAGPSSSGPAPSAISARHAALQAAALAQGIDPLLAHLDPTLLAPAVPGSSSGPGDLPIFTAKFNARTGQFAPTSSRTPGHLSEYERAKRMSEFYFDVNKWEEDLAKRGGRLMGEEGEGEGEEGEGSGKKRKRPTKKDLERFKEQKKQKKIAKTAWLRT